MAQNLNSEAQQIKRELRNIINELRDLANGIDRDFSGIGNDKCARKIRGVSDHYESNVLAKLNGLDLTVQSGGGGGKSF